MDLESVKRHFKAHPLRHTVAISAGLHLVAFYLFPTWNTFPTTKVEKAIKVKIALNQKTETEEKILPESKTENQHEVAHQVNSPKINRANFEQKAVIINRKKAITDAPRVASMRNPLQIHNPEKSFKPVKPLQPHSPDLNPVLEIQREVEFKVPDPRQPVRLLDRKTAVKLNAPVPSSRLAMAPRVPDDSFNKVRAVDSSKPAKRMLQTSSPDGRTPSISKPQILQMANVFSNSRPLSTSPAASFYNRKIPQPKTAAVRSFVPLDLNNENLENPTVSGIKRLGKYEPKTLRGVGQNIVSRTPKFLGGVAENEPVKAVSGNPVPSPVSSLKLFQMASIPVEFFEENLNKAEGAIEAPETKVASLTGGVSDISPELLGKIKEGFESQVWDQIDKTKYYPRMAQKREFEGQPVVALTLGDQGELLEFSIENPSPFKLLDRAALDAVKSAGPYPPIPKLLNMKSIRLTLPISFKLEER